VKRVLISLLVAVSLLAYPFFGFCGDIEVKVVSRSSSSWDGKILPDFPKGTPEITILRIRIPPGAALPMHMHPVINAGVLLAGTLTVITEDGKVLRLEAGDGIVEVVNTWHYGKNEGNSVAEIVVFYAGPAEAPLSIHK
jgi:quercetin dioxygenase-like cupin family protein